MLHSTTLSQAVGIAAALSLGLALVNMAPLVPLDGGRVLRAAMLAWLGRRAADAVTYVSFAGFAVFIVTAFWSDILHLWH